LASITEDDVREELQRVLASHEFRATKRSQEFLRYVVENKLSGHADSLKERTIGVDVFGRAPSYDPSDDATVRVKAGEVRKRLGMYYATEGARDQIRIELPAGTYVPEFQVVHPETAERLAASPGQIAAASSSPKSLRQKLLIPAALATLLIAGSLIWWTRTGSSATVLDEFWNPVLGGTSPVSVCAAYVPVWNLDRDPEAKGSVSAEDFVALKDQFVGGGDLIAVSRLSSLLTKLHRPYPVRIGSDMSLYDLRNSPAILVGYSHTQWREISKELRFFIDIAKRPLGITDNGAPTEWKLRGS